MNGKYGAKFSINLRFLVVYSVSFLLLTFFYYCIPLTIDDYFWGGESGINLLKNFFNDYNGRYLGNFLVIVLTRFKYLRVTIMPAIVILLCDQISFFIKKRRSITYFIISLIAFFSLAFVPRIKIFAQTLAWISGFSNYVTVTLLFVIYLNIMDRDIRNWEKNRYKKKEYFIALLLGFSSCLFLENITLTCLFIGVLVNMYFWLVRKCINKRHLFYSFGTILGTVLMFSNSSYYKMLNGSYSDGRVSGFRQIGIFQIDINSRLLFMIIIVCVALLLIALLPIFVTKNKNKRIELYFILMLIAISTVPLLFTNGGSIKYLSAFRIYFPQITFAIIFILDLLDEILKKIHFNTIAKQVIKVVLISAAFSVYVANIFIYYQIHVIENKMENYMQQQIEAHTEPVKVILFPDKYGKFIHEMNSYALGWEKEFKSYYSVDQGTEFEFVKNE